MRWLYAGVFCGLVCIAGFMIAPSAHADVLFDLSSCAEAGLPASCNNVDSGHSTLTYTSGGQSLLVSGLNGAAPNDLLLKLTGGDPSETGLGLFNTVSSEVNPGQSEVFNFSSLASHGFTSGTFLIGSLQAGEVGRLAFDSTSVTAVEVGSTGISAPIPFTFSVSQPLVTLTATSGNVLAAARLDIAPTPEPATLALVTPALGGLALLRRRRQRS